MQTVYVYEVHLSIYICWAVGFDDLGYLLFQFAMFFLLRKVEDITIISKLNHFGETEGLHLESSQQNYYIITL